MHTHFAHAALAHDHVTWDHRFDGPAELGGIDADHIGTFMAHLVHDLMRNMAVEGPVARIVGNEIKCSRLANRHEHR